MDKRIFHLKGRLSQDLGRNWTVEDMAAELRISVPHLQRLFKGENGGLTPGAWLNDLRLEAAAAMLADPNCFLRISEIAVAVGLPNESHFAKTFKAKYGMTPTQYRKNQAEIHQSQAPNEREE